MEAPFAFEKATATIAVWDVIEAHLDECRDVTSSKSIQDGFEQGRLRIVSKDKEVCPTITRSQSRMAKDSLVIEHEGRFLFPSEGLLAALQGLPEHIDFSAVSYEQEVEMIGQSVDGRMHEHLIEAVKEHIQAAQLKAVSLAA